MWTEAIRGCDYAVALEATQLVVRTQERFPTISRFLETVQSVSRRRALDQQAEALPAPWPEENTAKRGLAEAREALAGAVYRAQHWKKTNSGGNQTNEEGDVK